MLPLLPLHHLHKIHFLPADHTHDIHSRLAAAEIKCIVGLGREFSVQEFFARQGVKFNDECWLVAYLFGVLPKPTNRVLPGFSSFSPVPAFMLVSV
jgi:hypothetical protein